MPGSSTGMNPESENRGDGNPIMIQPGEKPLYLPLFGNVEFLDMSLGYRLADGFLGFIWTEYWEFGEESTRYYKST